SGIVHEYYCGSPTNAASLTSESYTCPLFYACINGACVSTFSPVNLYQVSTLCVSVFSFVNLSWSGVGENGGTTYWIGIAEGLQIGSPTIPYWDFHVDGTKSIVGTGVPSSSSHATYPYIVSPLKLDAGKTYTVWIWNGQTSNTRTFTAPTCIVVHPILNQPTAQCTNGVISASLSWSGIASPDGKYRIDIDEGTSFSGGLWTKDSSTLTNFAPDGFTPINGETNDLSFVEGRTYVVRVFNGQYSSVRKFTAPYCLPACVPTTCVQAGRQCGPVGDGCGGTLSCGQCIVGACSMGQCVVGSTVGASGNINEIEPNNYFSSANVKDVIEGKISGSIAGSENPIDVDVFNLASPMSGGHTVSLSSDQGMGLVAALFDSNQDLLFQINPSTLSAGGYYTADGMTKDISVPIAAGAFIAGGAMSTSSSNRPYTITINQDNSPLVPSRAIVYLNFEGGNGIRIGGRPGLSFGPFDASDIDPMYAGHTDEIISNIVQQVKEGYADYNVVIYSSRSDPIPSEPHTTIYFGSRDTRLIGLADGIDSFDIKKDDNAIVYTNTFNVFSPLNPSIEEISTVLANTATHEIGHTLGLVHIADNTEFMDTTATAQQMLLRQLFHRAPLNPTVFPIGYQDSPKLLEMALRPMLACTDSDGGQVYGVKGTLTYLGFFGGPITRTVSDTCANAHAVLNSCTGSGCYLAEFTCGEPSLTIPNTNRSVTVHNADGTVNHYYAIANCPNGCGGGVCA
ncbi:MAG: hypothetical protein Q7S74_06130, partial [Nanoarchaeota archaeon]|nr:hypothetical protein [Nanoarchaeota archaeon]